VVMRQHGVSHCGFGEAGSGLIGQIIKKPGVTKGGQIIMVSDVHHVRPRTYMHWHKLHTNHLVGLSKALLSNFENC
jgi:hypothetical protein